MGHWIFLFRALDGHLLSCIMCQLEILKREPSISKRCRSIPSNVLLRRNGGQVDAALAPLGLPVRCGAEYHGQASA